MSMSVIDSRHAKACIGILMTVLMTTTVIGIIKRRHLGYTGTDVSKVPTTGPQHVRCLRPKNLSRKPLASEQLLDFHCIR